MFSFGGSELFILAVIVLLLFGPDKIPQFARTIGRYVREFNKYKDIMESTIRNEMDSSEEKSEWQKEYEERLAGTQPGGAGQGAEGASGEAEGGEAATEAAPAPIEPSSVTATSEDDDEEDDEG